jgi:predicted RNA-binding protein with PIN domain
MMAQINKQQQQSAAAAEVSGSVRPKHRRKLERTSYRRTWDEEQALEKAEERRRKGQDPDWDVILSRNATLPLVIVDGYNIIHKWSRLKKHMAKGDLVRARQLLVDDLENLSSLKGWRIEVVFDGSHRRQSLASSSVGAAFAAAQGPTPTTPRADRASTKEVSKHGVRVVYTGSGVEADSYIEARCAQAKNVTSGKLTSSFLVATDDQMVRMAGLNAGALCMGAERFVTELKAVRQSVAYRVEAAVAAVNGHAIRPDALLRKSSAAAAAAAVLMNRRFGRGSVVIEDKRKRKEETKRRADAIPDLDIKIEVEVDEDGIPWWAKVPNHTHVYKY